MKCFIIPGILMILSSINSENIFLQDITPEEADQFIKSHPFELNYSHKVGENAISTTKDANGNTIYRGRKIDDPQNYIEEIYRAHQFHGQNGLGGYKYGYRDWNQAKVEEKDEKKNEVRGTYKYIRPNGEEFIATYIADETGFHQQDNRPIVELQPATDTPAVQRAKEEHFRRWNEEAQLAKNVLQQQRYRRQSDNGEYIADNLGQYNPDDETTGPPRGFFYAFDYDTPLLKNIANNEQLRSRRYVELNEKMPSKINYHEPIRAAAVHDVQIAPIQKTNLDNSNIHLN